MSCDKGYQGECCCECEHLIPIDVCHCGHCSTVEGWICKIFYEMSRVNGERGVMKHFTKEHGCCEMWTKRIRFDKNLDADMLKILNDTDKIVGKTERTT